MVALVRPGANVVAGGSLVDAPARLRLVAIGESRAAYDASSLPTAPDAEAADHPRKKSGEPQPDPLNESQLSRIWAAQSFPPQALAAADGRSLRVIHPGRRNAAAGPDFHDAVFALDGVERRGDVELHVRASAFRGHGHHRDPAYAALALHVVYLADDGVETALAGGGRAPVAAFAPWLARRAADIERWLAAPPLWQEPCRDAVARLGPEAVEAALAGAGRRRFAARLGRTRAAVAALGADEALWRALLDALGVGGDRDGFRRLAERFPASLALEVVAARSPPDAASALEAALLAVAGLASPPDVVVPLPPALSPPLAAGTRPANRPARRLAALARLYVRLGARFAESAAESVASAKDAKALLAAWQVAGGRGAPVLLGPQRAQELLLNAVLPFAAARGDLTAKVDALLAALRPAPAYGKTRFLETNLTAGGRRAVGSALAQQGLLDYLERWCRQGGCGRCPLS